MKNARQVCSCKNVTELQFEGMDGGIVVGKKVVITFLIYFMIFIYFILLSFMNFV